MKPTNEIDHKQRRCSTKIPYDHQYMLIAQLGNSIVTCVCANFDLNLMQVNKSGFVVDKDNSCEILYMFNNCDSQGTDILKKMGDMMIKKLQQEKYKIIYSICLQRRVRVYEQLGFKIETFTNINNVNRYLMVFKLEDQGYNLQSIEIIL